MNSLKKFTRMIKNSLLSRIASNILMVAVLFVTTISSYSDRLETNFTYELSNLNSPILITASNRSETTYPTDDKNVEGVLYGDKAADSLNSVDDLIDPQAQKQLLDPTQIPAKKQPIIDRSNSDNQLLEKAGQMFDDSGVLTDE
jgi:hypothetical protein